MEYLGLSARVLASSETCSVMRIPEVLPVPCIKPRKHSVPPGGDNTLLTYGSSASR